MKPWTEVHKTNYQWLFNYFKSIQNDIELDNYIDNNKRKLSGIIDGHPSWRDGSKEALYFMVSRYLYNKNNNDRYVKIYSKLGFDLMKKTKQKEELNELDEKELINYRPHSYFINILDNTEDSNIDIKKHFQYLFLSLLVLNPPIRTSFYSSCKLLNKQDDNNKKDNYIYLYRRGKIHAYLIVNKDKASNYKLYNMDKTLNKIEITNDKLCELINNSFITYPRQYLFEINKKKVSDATLLKYLRTITQVEGITVDMMRSSYITWFYGNNKTYGEREELSRQMRHSQSTASKNYLKVFDEPEEKETDEEKLKELNKELFNYKNIINDLKLKLSTYENNEDTQKAYNKKRNDILYLSNKNNKQPKENTMLKYQIKFKDQVYF